jgi:Asp-tRNA(Asn)/Glu-tRNA(Gln) amidotransferase A subunit family amidase
MWTLLRVPCINIPVPMDDVPMPVGVSLLARRYDDVALLKHAGRIAPALDPQPTME